jgi:hypothetical protein
VSDSSRARPKKASLKRGRWLQIIKSKLISIYL